MRDVSQPTNTAVDATQLKKASDADLVSLTRQGSVAAFRTIMERNNRGLFRAACGVLKDSSEAEDVVQEAYLRAFTNLGSYAGTAALSTWLMRIALNEALGRLRRRRGMVELDWSAEAATGGAEARVGITQFPLAHSVTSDPEHAAACTEIRRELECAIGELPDPFRVTFILRVVEQMSVAETAASLGVPEETVKTRVHRAKQRLRQALGECASILTDTFPFASAGCSRTRDPHVGPNKTDKIDINR
jgi:RNA polymerase sigma-70 factor (ECF subfamily)